MLAIRRSEQRGTSNFGWLQSQHTFSFGRYYDTQQMGVSALRVINEDRVEKGAGFAAHGHRNMEIISIVLDGSMKHQDSEGNTRYLTSGEIQLMSAGSGIIHSEYNASNEHPLHFLQIWITPNQSGGKPGYQQKSFLRTDVLTEVITPDGRNGTLKIRQDAFVSELTLKSHTASTLSLHEQRYYYLHLVKGEIRANNFNALGGDGVKVLNEKQLTIESIGDTDVYGILFDLPRP